MGFILLMSTVFSFPHITVSYVAPSSTIAGECTGEVKVNQLSNSFQQIV